MRRHAPARCGLVGESLPKGILEAADKAASECDLFLSIGTSAVVYPAAGLAHSARRRGAQIAEIHAQPTPLSSMTDGRSGRCGEILPALFNLASCYATINRVQCGVYGPELKPVWSSANTRCGGSSSFRYSNSDGLVKREPGCSRELGQIHADPRSRPGVNLIMYRRAME